MKRMLSFIAVMSVMLVMSMSVCAQGQVSADLVVYGKIHPENGKPWWPEELLTREQALQALTINVAKQMFIENERGSIKTGKYADFLLVTKDVLDCPENEIHEAKPAATYFEGKQVFPDTK